MVSYITRPDTTFTAGSAGGALGGQASQPQSRKFPKRYVNETLLVVVGEVGDPDEIEVDAVGLRHGRPAACECKQRG